MKCSDDFERLEATTSVVSEIRELFQSPSISIGVLHKGKTIYTKGFGQYDRATSRTPDVETVYGIGSCTKAFTSTALALMCQDGKISWEKPISHYLPEFRTQYNPVVGKYATLLDALSHSTGLASVPYAIMGRNMSVLVRPENVIHICSRLPCASEFRKEWAYNNWPFALTSALISKESECSWTQQIERISRTLSLNRTYSTYPTDDNFARAYVVLEDGSYKEVPLPNLKGGDAFEGSGSLRSCVKDMLAWCAAIIRASRSSGYQCDEAIQATSKTPTELSTSALVEAMRDVTTPRFPLAADPKQAYALGLFSFHLPTEEFNTVTNVRNIKTSYQIGLNSPPIRAVGHTGELGSFLAVYWTFPETESAVVVLANSSSANGDPTNIIAQVLTQALFDMEPKIDLVGVAAEVVVNAKSQWQKTVDEWASHRQSGTEAKDPQTYSGVYYSTDLRMIISVTIAHGNLLPQRNIQLRLRVNDLTEQTFDLYHYHHDNWTFLPKSRDECLESGLYFYILNWKAFIIHFDGLKSNQFQSLTWTLDPDGRVGPQAFYRLDQTSLYLY